MAYLGNSLLNKLYSFTPITATAGQAVFNASYAPGATIWFLTKASTGTTKLLQLGTDITATDGSTATLASGAAVGDVLSGISLAQFNVGNAGVTQAQFDNSTLYATTAFVQRALGSYQGFVGTAAATVNLTAAQVGSAVYLSSNSATQTVNLPASASLSPGAAFHFQTYTKGATIVANGTDTIDTRNSSVSSLTLTYQEDLLLVYGGSGAWYCADGSAMMRLASVTGSGPFGVSLGSSGYQKLPSGLIVQWGALIANATPGVATAVSFPITFPTTLYQVVLSNANGYSSGVPSTNSGTASGFNAFCSAGTQQLSYIAIGK